MPGAPTHFLDADPYQGLAAQPQIPDDDDYGTTATSRFDQFSSPNFSLGGSAARGGRPQAPTAGDEAIHRRGAVDTSREEEWDFEEFGKEGFDIPAYIKKVLTGADDEEKKRFRAALERYKQQNAKELQRNVFKQ